MIHNFEESNYFPPNIKFGQFLLKKRRLLGLNQTDFGKMLGVDQHTVSMWELGVTSPPIDKADEIIKKLGGKMSIENVRDLEPMDAIKLCPMGYNPWQE